MGWRRRSSLDSSPFQKDPAEGAPGLSNQEVTQWEHLPRKTRALGLIVGSHTIKSNDHLLDVLVLQWNPASQAGGSPRIPS